MNDSHAICSCPRCGPYVKVLAERDRLVAQRLDDQATIKGLMKQNDALRATAEKIEKERDYFKQRMEIAHGKHPSCGCDCAGCLGLIEGTAMAKIASAALDEDGGKGTI